MRFARKSLALINCFLQELGLYIWAKNQSLNNCLCYLNKTTKISFPSVLSVKTRKGEVGRHGGWDTEQHFMKVITCFAFEFFFFLLEFKVDYKKERKSYKLATQEGEIPVVQAGGDQCSQGFNGNSLEIQESRNPVSLLAGSLSPPNSGRRDVTESTQKLVMLRR